MDSSSLEVFIRQHCPWEQLPPAVRQSFENNRILWEKEVCAFSLKNQLPWRTSLVRKLYPHDERRYYTEMLKASRERLMVRHRRRGHGPAPARARALNERPRWSRARPPPPLAPTRQLFPYHLSDVIVPALRITPFRYYVEIMHDLMLRERTYDTLPNFTAKDCTRAAASRGVHARAVAGCSAGAWHPPSLPSRPLPPRLRGHCWQACCTWALAATSTLTRSTGANP